MESIKVEVYKERYEKLPNCCKFRYLDEMIGFEGQLVDMCCHKEHPGNINIYPQCKVTFCPIIKMTL